MGYVTCSIVLVFSIVCTAVEGFSHAKARGMFENTRSMAPLAMSVEEDAGAAWKSVKKLLPPIVTGAWTGQEGDQEPLGALYNLIFVRLVTLVCTAAYCKALLGGGGQFSLNFGVGGPVEVPPLGVAIVVARILLPPI